MIFNAIESKLLFCPASFDGQWQYENIKMHFMGGTIEYVRGQSHLENIISTININIMLHTFTAK